MRLDRFLANAADDLSRSRLKSLILEGQVRKSGAVVSEPNHRVKCGDELEVAIPAAKPLELAAEDIRLDIEFEDEHLLVVHKPAGMVVHPAPGHDKGTLVHALLAHCGSSLSGIGGVQRPGIVHRIDKDVSGLLVIAKHDKAHIGLAGQFTLHSINRQYDAIVYGTPAVPSGRIDKPIGRHPRDRKRQAVTANGKHAITDYKLIRSAGTVSHLKCTLHTGRTHQIRVHLMSLGNSLIGDTVYQPRRKPKLPAELVTLVTDMNRIALHAALIGFDHPVTGARLQFEASMPDIFPELLHAGED